MSSMSAMGIENDSGVRFTLLYRIWVICAGAVIVICVPLWFTASEQGYYYTFSSLVAAQILFELGSTFVVTQLTAHEKARLIEGAGTEINPLDRLALILQFSDRWFVVAAVSYCAIIGGAGLFFFAVHGPLDFIQWGWPWLLMVCASAAVLRQAARLALLEGAGEIAAVARLRLYQGVIGNVAMWALLFAGGKLWALTVVPATAALFSFVWLRRHSLIRDLKERLANGVACTLDWRTEVFPLQWRIALSWASGYLIFQAITPIAFARLGAVAAGQIGLALAIFNGVQSVGMSWMYTQTPRYAELVARNQREALNELFVASIKLSVLVVGAGIASVLAGVWALGWLGLDLAQRVPPIEVMACFGLSSLVNSVVFSLALYMRSHKEEPMLVSSVVGGLIVLVGVYVAASYSLLATALTYLLITAGIGLPWAWLLFVPYYSRQKNHV